MSSERKKELREILIEFNRTQVLVRTDVAVIAEYILESHGAMLVPRGTDVVGKLEVFHSRRGYACHGANYLDFGGEVSQLFEWLSRDILEQFLRTHIDLLWIHAGVVTRRDRALLIVGPSAQGKSTLVTLLMERGWLYLSDEMAPIRLGADEVLPYLRTPVRRLDPGRAIEIGSEDVLERRICPLSSASISFSPSTVRLMAFPKFSYGSATTLSEMTPGAASLELARNATNFSELREQAVARAARLALTIPCYSLKYGEGFAAAQVLDRLTSGNYPG